MTSCRGACWPLSEFMLSTWNGPQVEDPNLRADALAAAGMNTVRWSRRGLDCLRRAGLKALVDDAELVDAADLRDDHTVWGYHLVDEPDVDQYVQIAAEVAAFRQADPTHPVYINLSARAGYAMTEFIRVVQPDVLSYDYYQWWYGPYQRWWEGDTGYFARLEQHREAASAVGIPLINWVEVTANRHDDRYRNVPAPSNSESRVRQSAYTGLAYGLKGVQWFHGGLLYEPHSLELNAVGRNVARLNAELACLGSILVGLESVGVFHTLPLPRGTRQAPGQHWVVPQGSDIVLGEMRDSGGQPYLLVANRNAEDGCRVRLLFQRPIGCLECLDRATGSWHAVTLMPQEDAPEAYDAERIQAFLGVPVRSRERLEQLRHLNGYLPPFQVADLLLTAGDGALLRVGLTRLLA